MIKIELKKYLDKYFKEHFEKTNEYPTICNEMEIDTKMYIGEMDDDGYVRWQYLDNSATYDFDKYEKENNINIHDDIKELYSSYIFFDLQGFYKGEYILLDTIHEKLSLEEIFYGFFNTDEQDLLPIGAYGETNSQLCISNKNGGIYMYDWEHEELAYLCNDMKELLNNLTVFRN